MNKVERVMVEGGIEFNVPRYILRERDKEGQGRGWRVCIDRKDLKVNRYFGDKVYNGCAVTSFDEAKQYLADLEPELRTFNVITGGAATTQ